MPCAKGEAEQWGKRLREARANYPICRKDSFRREVYWYMKKPWYLQMEISF